MSLKCFIHSKNKVEAICVSPDCKDNRFLCIKCILDQNEHIARHSDKIFELDTLYDSQKQKLKPFANQIILKSKMEKLNEQMINYVNSLGEIREELGQRFENLEKTLQEIKNKFLGQIDEQNENIIYKQKQVYNFIRGKINFYCGDVEFNEFFSQEMAQCFEIKQYAQMFFDNIISLSQNPVILQYELEKLIDTLAANIQINNSIKESQEVQNIFSNLNRVLSQSKDEISQRTSINNVFFDASEFRVENPQGGQNLQQQPDGTEKLKIFTFQQSVQEEEEMKKLQKEAMNDFSSSLPRSEIQIPLQISNVSSVTPSRDNSFETKLTKSPRSPPQKSQANLTEKYKHMKLIHICMTSPRKYTKEKLAYKRILTSPRSHRTKFYFNKKTVKDPKAPKIKNTTLKRKTRFEVKTKQEHREILIIDENTDPFEDSQSFEYRSNKQVQTNPVGDKYNFIFDKFNRNKQKNAITHSAGISQIVCCQQGETWKLIATGSLDKSIRIWYQDQSHFDLKKVLNGHRSGITKLEVFQSQMQNYLISGSQDGEIRIWNPAKEQNEQLGTFSGHQKQINCLWKFENSLISGSDDCTLKLWDLSTYSCRETVTYSEKVSSVCVWLNTSNMESKLLVSQGQTVMIYPLKLENKDIINTEKSESFVPHETGVSYICSVTNKKQVQAATGSFMGEIKLWNIEYKECMQTFEGHSDYIYKLLWDTQRQLLVSAGRDGTVKLWAEDECVQSLETGNAFSVDEAYYGDFLRLEEFGCVLSVGSSKSYVNIIYL